MKSRGGWLRWSARVKFASRDLRGPRIKYRHAVSARAAERLWREERGERGGPVPGARARRLGSRLGAAAAPGDAGEPDG